MQNTETFYPKNRDEWRKWLIENHLFMPSIWLLQYKKSTQKPSISWSEAVEEALCFGWIDSIRKSIDNESFIQFFTKRKPKSGWSKINKEKVVQLISKGLMAEAGHESIARAKENGSWLILDEAEELIIPADLTRALESNLIAKNFFLNFSKSSRKAILQWISFAKRTETREKRILETVELASENQKPKQFR